MVVSGCPPKTLTELWDSSACRLFQDCRRLEEVLETFAGDELGPEVSWSTCPRPLERVAVSRRARWIVKSAYVTMPLAFSGGQVRVNPRSCDEPGFGMSEEMGLSGSNSAYAVKPQSLLIQCTEEEMVREERCHSKRLRFITPGKFEASRAICIVRVQKCTDIYSSTIPIARSRYCSPHGRSERAPLCCSSELPSSNSCVQVPRSGERFSFFFSYGRAIPKPEQAALRSIVVDVCVIEVLESRLFQDTQLMKGGA